MELLEKDGIVKASSNAHVYAYNGNECTLDKTDNNYYYKPLIIYIQNGNPLDVYIHNGNNAEYRYNLYTTALNCTIPDWYVATIASDYTEFCITKSLRGYSYVATTYGQGIGSGAGYIEVSNGTYTVDPSMN